MITSAYLLLAHGVVLLFAPELLFKLFNSDISTEGSVTAVPDQEGPEGFEDVHQQR